MELLKHCITLHINFCGLFNGILSSRIRPMRIAERYLRRLLIGYEITTRSIKPSATNFTLTFSKNITSVRVICVQQILFEVRRLYFCVFGGDEGNRTLVRNLLLRDNLRVQSTDELFLFPRGPSTGFGSSSFIKIKVAIRRKA